MDERFPRWPSTPAVKLLLTTSVVVTVAMVAFPPFTSFYGTEYAFILDGPEWARQTRALLDVVAFEPRRATTADAAQADAGGTTRVHALLLQK